MILWYWIALLILQEEVESRGHVPDGSKEGLVRRLDSYEDGALFRYILPKEVTRATFEFAGFQNHPECPSLWITICLQHGGYPVISLNNGSFQSNYYLKRTESGCVQIPSGFQTHSSHAYPVFNPYPGPWFIFAFISPENPEEGKISFLYPKCRYSVGSIGIWNKADNVQLLHPGHQTIKTTSRYSYFKLLIPDSVPFFDIRLEGCRSLIKKTSRPWFKEESCLEQVSMRGRALPFHEANDATDQTVVHDISTESIVVLEENRPYKSDAYYYLLIVSNGKVAVNVSITLGDCGEPGLYGPKQRNWFLEERGLVWKENKTSSFREPEAGFQLFRFAEIDPELNFLDEKRDNFNEGINEYSSKKECISRFELTRIDDARYFYARFLLQGRSWYTNWITVLQAEPVFTRFDIRESTDSGATLLIDVQSELDKLSYKKDYQIMVCISHNQEPQISLSVLNCSEEEKIILNSDFPIGSKYIPFPEYGAWYLGYQLFSLNNTLVKTSFLMVSIDIRLRPCGYQNENSLCGPFGVCIQSGRDLLHISSCKCFSGYRGWTCDDATFAYSKLKILADTLILTLSNLAFLPAVIAAVYYKLWTQGLFYFTTMFFSTFYHTCDEEAHRKNLPLFMDSVCHNLYVDKEVLQFCDFYSATLSFWITIIALSKLSYKLTNFLNALGVILIAVLIQYNRTGFQVFAIPIPLGIFLLFLSLGLKGKSRGRILKPNTRCIVFMLPGVMCSILAIGLFVFLESSRTYPYVHGAWHVLIALSLIFFVPLCKETNEKEVGLSLEEITPTISIETDSSSPLPMTAH